MNYFILINNVQQGPFTIDELRQHGITQDSLVWAEGMSQWTPAWKVEELKPLFFDQQNAQQQDTPPIPTQPTPPPPPQPTPQPPVTPQTEQPKKKNHKGLIIALVVVVVIFFILALTNPGQAEHRQAILDKLDSTTEQVDNIQDTTLRGVVSALTGVGNGMAKELVKELIDEDLEYHNYIIFSTTTLHSDLLRHDIKTSTGYLGHVNAIKLSTILPDLIMQQMTGADNDEQSLDNGTTETSTTTVDGDGNQTTETTRTTKKNGVTIDSISKRVTNRIADEVAKKVKSEVKQDADSATTSGIDAIINDVLNFIKGL